MEIELQPGELKINGGRALYVSPGGKKLSGMLIVTNKRILYDTAFDMEAREGLPNVMFVRWGSLGYLEIDKADIRKLDERGRMSGNKVILTLNDGSKHVFNSGLLGKNFGKAIRTQQVHT